MKGRFITKSVDSKGFQEKNMYIGKFLVEYNCPSSRTVEGKFNLVEMKSREK